MDRKAEKKSSQVRGGQSSHKVNNQDLLRSVFEVDCLILDLEHLTRRSRRLRSIVLGTKEGLVSEVPMQRLALKFIDGNFWQLKERNEDESGEILSCSSPEHVQNDRDKLVLEIALTNGFVPGSLTNETMPCRQRGQAIDPVGPWATVEVQIVEQRYNAHRVQNSCPQPAHDIV
ncbi:hypothetical protein SADUNF_Sadunf18G0079900 [Salix dunnii]|uniref:Uncharacterized protein n=1 Tax=Salix dunnii TaxID=1413687 RepID=A0A835J6K9_9ROSI|nr:hypothetical protein SADUNF_Sadunf18G0079900 [Salix dunnii]